MTRPPLSAAHFARSAVPLSLLLHAALLTLALILAGHAPMADAPPGPVTLALIFAPPPETPPQTPAETPPASPPPAEAVPRSSQPEPAPQPLPEPTPEPAPAPPRPSLRPRRPTASAPSPPPTAPPSHFGPAGPEDAPTASRPASGGDGRAALGAFVEAVKRRVQAAKLTPPGLERMAHECLVNFHVVIDPAGHLAGYDIDGCGNPFLDAAARAAVLKASPFPRPPDLGATRYDVYGNLVFREP